MSDADVFASAAEYYARYRPPFPPELYAAIEAEFQLDGRGVLLDLGAGTGQVAIALHHRFERTVAIDVSEEMIAVGRRIASERGIEDIAWHAAPAEEFAAIDPGPYRLITLANALHWMDQPRVLAACREHLEAGGGVAVVNMPGMLNIDDTEGAETWVQETVRVIRRHLGEQRRAGSRVYRPPRRSWREELKAAGFHRISSGRAAYAVTWSIEEITGYLYTTSFANRAVLGDRVEAFETDLHAALLALDPAGQFPRALEADWLLAVRP